MFKELIIQTILFLFPAYITNICACLFGGGAPLDFGKNFLDGKRILGNGKTFRGSIFGFSSGSITGILLGDPLTGILLSAGAITGDAIGSFVKRRLDIKRGAPAPILDQLDFVAGALLFTSPLNHLSLPLIITSFLITLLLHISVNFVGYRMGLKDVPW